MIRYFRQRRIQQRCSDGGPWNAQENGRKAALSGTGVTIVRRADPNSVRRRRWRPTNEAALSEADIARMGEGGFRGAGRTHPDREFSEAGHEVGFAADGFFDPGNGPGIACLS
jgi:hypothetical protein